MKKFPLLVTALALAIACLGQVQGGSVASSQTTLKAPFVYIANADFAKEWGQANPQANQTSALSRIKEVKGFVRGDPILIYMQAPFSTDFEGMAYRYTILNKDRVQLRQGSIRVAGINDWIRSRSKGAPPTLTLPVPWYEAGKDGLYLVLEFVQNGTRFSAEFTAP